MEQEALAELTRNISDQTKVAKLKVKSAVHKVQESADKLENAILTETPYWVTLNKITSDEYYKKCTDLAEKFNEQHINRPSPIMQPEDQKDWKSLVWTAEKLQDPLKVFMENIRDQIGADRLEVHTAGLKGVERSIQKVEMDYDGNWRRLLDVCRGGVVHQSFEDLYHILELLLNRHDNVFGFRVVRVKNRYKKPTYQGWADIHLLIEPVATVNKDSGSGSDDHDKGSSAVDIPMHICEIQFSHSKMWEKRKKSMLFGHKQYKMSRALDNKLKATAKKIGGVKGQKMMAEYLEKTQDLRAAVQHSVFVQQTESKRNLWFYVDKRTAIRLCSVYGIGVGLVVGTSLFAKEWRKRIVPEHKALWGMEGGQWIKAQGASYLVMGLANVCALNWMGTKGMNRILKADAFVYGVWGLQNLYNAMAPHNAGNFRTEMWLNSVVCSVSGLYALLASRK